MPLVDGCAETDAGPPGAYLLGAEAGVAAGWKAGCRPPLPIMGLYSSVLEFVREIVLWFVLTAPNGVDAAPSGP